MILNYQSLALDAPDYNARDDFDRAELITAEITIDELAVKDTYVAGKMICKVLYEQDANNEQGYAFWPTEIVSLDGMEWIAQDGMDYPVAESGLSKRDILLALQVECDKRDTYLNSKNVREV